MCPAGHRAWCVSWLEGQEGLKLDIRAEERRGEQGRKGEGRSRAAWAEREGLTVDQLQMRGCVVSRRFTLSPTQALPGDPVLNWGSYPPSGPLLNSPWSTGLERWYRAFFSLLKQSNNVTTSSERGHKQLFWETDENYASISQKKCSLCTATQNVIYFHMIYRCCGSPSLDPLRSNVSWFKSSDLFLNNPNTEILFLCIFFCLPYACEIFIAQS